MMPTFAVVGQPNKGKSSIVATLSRRDDIHISEQSGTTTKTDIVDVCVFEQCVYKLADTPGFQRARMLLAWLKEQSQHAADRQQAIKQFLATPELTAHYVDEAELLTPIMNGAGIIYVVDASVPYHNGYEAEMSILQWTGQPRMALINPIRSTDYIDQWQQALGQYFSLVRIFNPLKASFDDQLTLLAGFAQLELNWQKSMHHAQQQLQKERDWLQSQASELIATALANMLHYRISLPITPTQLEGQLKQPLTLKYQRQLREFEQQAQQRLRNLYQHFNLTIDERPLPSIDDDLFNTETWQLWGISQSKLIALSAAAGLVTGALVDIGVGGTSLLFGSLTGALIGGAGGYFANQEVSKLKVTQAQHLQIGPVSNLAFSFALTGRLLNFAAAIIQRSHAQKHQFQSQDDDNWLNYLGKTQQIKFTANLSKLAKSADDEKALQQCQEQLLEILLRMSQKQSS